MKVLLFLVIFLIFQFFTYSQFDQAPVYRSLTCSAVITNIGCSGIPPGAIDMTVSGGSTPYSFLWYNGLTTEDMTGITNSGYYCVTIIDSQGSSVTGIWHVSSLATEHVSISASATTTCIGDTITLTASSGFSNYIWSNGDTTRINKVTVSGTYHVDATNTCGIISGDNRTVVFISQDAPVIQAFPSTVHCLSDPVVLSLNNSYNNYHWSSGQTSSSINVHFPGNYSVTVSGSSNCNYPPSLPISITLKGIEIIYPDSAINCVDQPVQLQAACLQYYVDYIVHSIPYAPEALTGINAGIDANDQIYGPFQIGFDFTFFGNTYTQFFIGSNGWIGFSGALDGSNYDPWATKNIPNAGHGVPKNCIMGPWEDWNTSAGPNNGNYVYYQVYGSGPNRKLVISYVDIPLFPNIINNCTFQIVLYEGSNIIDNHLIYIQPYYDTIWNSGHGVQGIQNADGSLAVVVPGRNNTTWTATEESWRYTPISVVTAWFADSLNSDTLGKDLQITVPPYGKYYLTSRLGDSLLSIDSITINNTSIEINSSVENESCYGINDGKINLNLLFPAFNVNYLWSNGSTTETIDHLSPGNYSVTVSIPNDSCIIQSDFTITGPAVLSSQVYAHNLDASGYGYVDMAVWGGVSPYSWHWSIGATTENVSDLTYGIYFVTVTDACGYSIVDTALISLGISEQTGFYDICLYQNEPNPFRGNTAIRFYLPLRSFAELEIRNIMGEKLAVLVSKELDPGIHSITFDATGISAGMYFLILTVADERRTRMIQVE
ncbi:MAG: SprB repeat-containing protein [Bacteroidia bacterium]|nr:SprB repeat-containing protein [Bacteroidia bacterium]